VTPTAEKPELIFFVFAYWHDARFKSKAGGPIKVYELTQNLTKLGHRVYLFIPKIGYPEQQTTAHVCPVPFINLPVLRFISFQVFAFLWALRVALRKDHPDIIYVRIMWSFIPMILAKMFSIPAILEVNDSPHGRTYPMTPPIKRMIVRTIDRITYALSDHIMPVTTTTADDLHRIEHIPLDKITVLPSGTNTDLFRPLDRSECCKELGLPPENIYIGFIGTFFHHQGIDTLIASAPSLVSENVLVRFLIVGDGPMMGTWKSLVNKANLESDFIFPGFVPYERVPVYCGAMDICVAPLHEEAGESTCVKIFDYLACEKPAVISNIKGTGQEFLDSGAVVLFPPGDSSSLTRACLSLIDDKEIREAMGKKGRAFTVALHSRLKVAEEVETTALRIIDEHEKCKMKGK